MLLQLILALSLTVAATGCGALPAPVEAPKATVQGASVRLIGLSDIEAQVDLNLDNPNRFSLPLSRIDWVLAVGGTDAVKGTVELAHTIPALAMAPVTTSFRIDPTHVAAIVARIAAGERNYTLRAKLHFTTQLGNVSVDITHQGELSVPSTLPSGLGDILRRAL